MAPAISFIVPVYNGAEFLRAAVQSIVSQSVADWELLLVDDGSDDALTPALCDSLAGSDPRIRVIHKPNGGLSDARNAAIPIARGDFISFVDADDILHPRFAEITLLAARRLDADIVYTRAKWFSKSYRPASIPNAPEIMTVDRDEVIEKTLYQTGFDNAAWGKIYARTLWKDLRFVKGLYFEDLEIFCKPLLASKTVAYAPYFLYGYRQHPDSIMSLFNPRRTHVLRAADMLAEYISDNAPRFLPAARTRRLAAYFSVLMLIYRNRVDMPELERRCLRTIRSLRKETLRNPKARRKDRIGALASMAGGRKLLKILAHF